MTTRTSKRTVTFARPFTLGGCGTEFPAGQYFIETDEERVDELSFPFYRRTATMMRLIADPLRPGITETAIIDPQHLEAALEADAAAVSNESGLPAEQSAVSAIVKAVAP
jgi:hypothetical protein